MKSVFIETSILSYLTSRPSGDLLASARQQISDRWRHDHRGRFDLFVSAVVERKAGKGNPDAAERRLSALRGLPRLAVNEQVEQLAEQLISRRALPETAVEDALHIAIAAVHRVDYLLTWNCRHIDNAETKPAIRAVCIALEYPCPEICAPEELMGGLSDE